MSATSIVFEKSKEDLKTGIIHIETEKKLAAYHQYYAVNKAVESTLKAASAAETTRAVLCGIRRAAANPSLWFLYRQTGTEP